MCKMSAIDMKITPDHTGICILASIQLSTSVPPPGGGGGVEVEFGLGIVGTLAVVELTVADVHAISRMHKQTIT